MFAAVTFQQTRSALPRPLRRLFGGGGIEAELCEYAGSRYWLLVQRLPPGEEPDWRGIARLCGRLGSKLVLPRGVLPPPGYGLRLCPLEDFRGRVAVAAAEQVLRQLGASAAAEPVGFIDPEARFCAEAERLAAQAAALWVYTRRRERYRAAQRRISEQGGAMLYAEGAESLSACVLAVAPSAAAPMRLGCPAISVEGARLRGSPTADRLQLRLPEEAWEAAPPGLAAEDFFGAAALYGEGGLPFPLEVSACRADGILTDIEGFSSLCRQKVQKNYNISQYTST